MHPQNCLNCDHRTTRATSEGCCRNTARWPCVYCSHYKKYIIPTEDLFLTTFLNEDNPTSVIMRGIKMLFCDDRAATVQTSHDRIIQHSIDSSTGCQHEWEIVVSLSCSCLVAQIIVRISQQKWTCRETGLRRSIPLPYVFMISYGGLAAVKRNWAIFLKKRGYSIV